MGTTVAQRSRAKGWRKPPGSVCVDRTSRWGNWWRITRDDADLTIADTPEARWIRDHVHELAWSRALNTIREH